ncbi:hypothetical protein ABEB36_015370 [Hypothenemus hampei]|uniref:Uncharacterized protein n=1 Tax=Hypothenemus hampei TaxID=57062 RepID=A0ABD1E0Y5_HYPHA
MTNGSSNSRVSCISNSQDMLLEARAMMSSISLAIARSFSVVGVLGRFCQVNVINNRFTMFTELSNIM